MPRLGAKQVEMQDRVRNPMPCTIGKKPNSRYSTRLRDFLPVIFPDALCLHPATKHRTAEPYAASANCNLSHHPNDCTNTQEL